MDWRKYRRRQSRRGLRQRLQTLGIHDLESYEDLLRQSPREREHLLHAMRVTVTRFFRDPSLWTALQEKVLPVLSEQLAPGVPFRAWSAGCAGGEEAYSLAIVWSLLGPASLREQPLEILGTDIDREVLERARRARYDLPALEKIPAAAREQVVADRSASAWKLAGAIRRYARFEEADLLVDPIPRDQQLILCRYLAFTYYRGERLQKVIDRLCSALATGGALVVGLKEPIPSALADRVEAWPGVPAVFRSKSTG